MTYIMRGTKWNVSFRFQKKSYFRSCGTSDLEEAKKIGPQIFATVVREQATPQELSQVSQSLSVGTSTQDDAGLEQVVRLFEQWLQSPYGSKREKRPRAVTGRNYVLALRRLAKRLNVATVKELRSAIPSANATALGLTDENYDGIVRSAYSIFSKGALTYYESHGLTCGNPLAGYLPAQPLIRTFRPPPAGMLKVLIAAARSELEPADLPSYLLFLLCLGAGCRVQEAAFLKWKDVRDEVIVVTTSAAHRNKAGKHREIPVGSKLLIELEEYRNLPGMWVVPSGCVTASEGVPKGRAYRAARRLAKWLKAKGVRSTKPVHWLRKVFGSKVTNTRNIFAASMWLGHASVKTTERAYAGVDQGLNADVI